MGRLSGTPHSFAVTREDTLEFMDSLQSRPPGFLFDKLREADLLILGMPHSRHGWPAFSRTKRREGDAPVLFVDRAKGTTEAPAVGSARRFRPRALPPVERSFRLEEETSEPPPIAASLAAPSGAVFLSCAASRTGAWRESIREALDRAGVDVILDHDDAPLAPRWEKRLKSALATFAPRSCP